MTRLFSFVKSLLHLASEIDSGRQSYQTLISSFFKFSLLSFAILKYRQYFLMLQTLKLNNKKEKNSLFYEEKCLVGLTPGQEILNQQNFFNTRCFVVTYQIFMPESFSIKNRILRVIQIIHDIFGLL
jgi:hypothetical protein